MEIIPNFAVLEGGDGSGTTTQMSFLEKRLKDCSIPFFSTFEPTDSNIGRIIRSALKKEVILHPETICMLFASDRNEHIYGPDGIIDHAGKGELVVSDRYAVSSFVYQGIDCGNNLPKLLNSRFPAPEVTIFLDIKPGIAVERMKSRPTLDIYEYLDFQEKVYAQYLFELDMYSKAGAKVEVIDASKSTQEVSDQIWNIIRQMPIFKAGEKSI